MRVVGSRPRTSEHQRARDSLPPPAGVGSRPRTSEHQRASDSLPPSAGVGGSPRTTRSGLVATKRVIFCRLLRVWAVAHERSSISERVILCRLLRAWAGAHERRGVALLPLSE